MVHSILKNRNIRQKRRAKSEKTNSFAACKRLGAAVSLLEGREGNVTTCLP